MLDAAAEAIATKKDDGTVSLGLVTLLVTRDTYWFSFFILSPPPVTVSHVVYFSDNFCRAVGGTSLLKCFI
jgi:hypothetical protein